MTPTLRVLAAIATLLVGMTVAVAQPAAEKLVWVTLGTSGGPVPNALRSQPANALVVGSDIVLVDVGDGVVEQLARAGLQLGNVKAVIISHLHMDHAAGLEGVIGLRWQNNMRGPFTIYGPPGTQTMVDGIITAMQPSIGAGYGFDNGFGKEPVKVQVQEFDPAKSFEVLPGVTVQSVENTHYSFSPGTEDAKRYKSYSFRIEGKGRTIVYTGDTGPSEAVTRLAHGAELLVSEVQNLAALEKAIFETGSNVPDFIKKNLDAHLRQHHLAPEDVGKMAKAAEVGKVVLTHLGPGPAEEEANKLFLPGVKSAFDGPVVVAEDLERF